MDQLILFHKPNKKARSEKKIGHFIPQTKHTLTFTVDTRAQRDRIKVVNHFDCINPYQVS
jgi:hypothetical protein